MSHRRTFIKLDEMTKGYNTKVLDWKKEIESDAKREEILECIHRAVPIINEEMEDAPDNSSSPMSDIQKLSDDQVFGTNQEQMIVDDPVADIQIDQDLMQHSSDSNTSQTQHNIEIHSDIKIIVQNSMGVHFDEQLFNNLMDMLRLKGEDISPDYISALLAKLRQHHAPGYQIIGDNIDLHVKPKHMTSTNQNKDIHWFNLNAVLNRVTGNDLCDSKPSKSITDMESIDFLPSQDDNLAFLTDIIPLAARVISDKIPAFEKFKNCVVRHIPHKYSDAMAEKSNQVRLSKCVLQQIMFLKIN